MDLKKFKQEIGWIKNPKWPVCSRCKHFSLIRAFGVDTEVRCNYGKPFKTGKTSHCDKWESREL